ncbi:MAG: alpha/beta fold hydrolase, partial [Chloroflexota bacterium]
HGYAGSARWWERNLLPLANAHTVFALDLPGFGNARMLGPYTFERVVSLLEVWIDANGIGSASLVGHSMGGQVAMLFAAEHPDRTKNMVLLAPAGLPFSGSLIGIGRQAFLSRADGDRRFTPIVTFGALRAGPRILWQAVQQIRQVDVRPRLTGLTVPTLILWGERDRLIPAANATLLSAAMPHAEIRIIPGMGHNIFFEDPKLVNEAILAFIGRSETADA